MLGRKYHVNKDFALLTDISKTGFSASALLIFGLDNSVMGVYPMHSAVSLASTH